MVKLKSATPHEIKLMLPDGTKIVIPKYDRKYGEPMRIVQNLRKRGVLDNGVPVYEETTQGIPTITGLPLPEKDVVWLVGSIFIGHPALKHRHDIMALDTQRGVVYDSSGRWITRLIKVSK